MVRKITLLFSLVLLLSYHLWAEDLIVSDSIIIPDPTPFSLDAGSAIYCINLMKNNRYLEKKDKSDECKIVEVKTVWSQFLEYDESFPEGHRKRYDIIVNGTNLDWDNSYIEYGNEILNLHLLFLYRNQHPPENLGDYSLD